MLLVTEIVNVLHDVYEHNNPVPLQMQIDDAIKQTPADQLGARPIYQYNAYSCDCMGMGDPLRYRPDMSNFTPSELKPLL